MKRQRSFQIIPTFLTALSSLTSCFAEKAPNSTLNLDQVPYHVAIVVPVLGVSVDIPIPAAVGDSLDITVPLGNVGPIAATGLSESASSTFGAPFSFKDGVFPGTGGTCTDTLEPEAICNLILTFSPLSAGDFTTTLTFEYVNGVMVFEQEMELIGHTSAELTLSSPAYDFGLTAVGAMPSTTLTVTNVGFAQALALHESLDDPLAPPFQFLGGLYPGTGGTCGVTLDPGASCQLVLSYAPPAPGPHLDTLTLEYDDGGGNASTLTFNLSGTGF